MKWWVTWKNCDKTNMKTPKFEECGKSKFNLETMRPHSQTSMNSPDDFLNVSLKSRVYEFSESVGMQGVRYMFMGNIHWMRRVAWTLVVTIGFAYSIYIMTSNLQYYYTYPTTMQTKVVYNHSMTFPAVTICNMNQFQKSKVTFAERVILASQYGVMDEIPDERFSLYNIDPYEHIGNMTEFYYRTSYDYKDNVIKCTYKKRECDFSMFKLRLMDAGVCATFNPTTNNTETQFQTTAGKSNGLNILLYLDQEEHLPGPNMLHGGFIIRVHDPKDETTIVNEYGLASLPNHGNDLAISQTITILQKPPYGQCGERALKFSTAYSQNACLSECETDHMMTMCSCKQPYQPGNVENVCDPDVLDDCVYWILEEHPFDASKCDCPIECRRVEYDAKLNNIKMSKKTSVEMTLESEEGVVQNDVTEDTIQIRVFYPIFEYRLVEQKLVYNFEKLLSDLGGAGGLLLGCSIATIAECIDFVGVVLWIGCIKFGRRKTNQVRRINLH